ncbi:MAG: PKD domain-containing protein [Planctomycetota bacterium]
MKKLCTVIMMLGVLLPVWADIEFEHSTTGPYPPEEVTQRDAQRVQAAKIAIQSITVQVTLTAPGYNWRHGCGPTAVGMVVGYYDGLGYTDLISGSAATQTGDVDQAIASGGTWVAPNPAGSELHFEDYCIPRDDNPPNPIQDDDYITASRTPHPDDCIADYMNTSKSTAGQRYGWSSNGNISPSFMAYVNQQNPSYGPVTTDYYGGAITWDVLTNEIDNSRPMVFLVDSDGNGSTDHFVTIVGYRVNDSVQEYGCLDTWTPAQTIRWEIFRPMAAGDPWGVRSGHAFSFTNHPPDADAGPDQIVERDSTAGAQVTLDGSGSSDPDGDPLTYEWTWCGNSATGINPTVTLPMGTATVTLTVSDGVLSDSDTVNIDVVDTTPPDVVVVVPIAGSAVQDGVTLQAQATDFSEVIMASFTLREQDGGNGTPVGFEDIPATYNSGTGLWEYLFDSTQLPDGYYQILATAVDESGNVGTSDIVLFSIRNWAIVELLPASKEYRAGRTMPVKFSLRISEAVDPAMPFVYNEQLRIDIYKTSSPGTILQSALFGDTSKDYRIDVVGELYITNFKTDRKPADYTVDIWRIVNDFFIDSFTFETKRK